MEFVIPTSGRNLQLRFQTEQRFEPFNSPTSNRPSPG